jgi:hypothetical protein
MKVAAWTVKQWFMCHCVTYHGAFALTYWSSPVWLIESAVLAHWWLAHIVPLVLVQNESPGLLTGSCWDRLWRKEQQAEKQGMKVTESYLLPFCLFKLQLFLNSKCEKERPSYMYWYTCRCPHKHCEYGCITDVVSNNILVNKQKLNPKFLTISFFLIATGLGLK